MRKAGKVILPWRREQQTLGWMAEGDSEGLNTLKAAV